LLLCARLGIKTDEALMVGDSTVDLATGKAAGVRTCAVAWGLGERAELESADHFCATPSELSALLGRLRA
jgi:phosphoglycolate phosphatase